MTTPYGDLLPQPQEGAADRSILVAGDVVADRYIYKGQERRPGSTLNLGTIHRGVGGGADLLARLLEYVASRLPLRITRGFKRSESLKNAPCGFCVMKPYPKGGQGKGDVWRMAEALGFTRGGPSQNGSPNPSDLPEMALVDAADGPALAAPCQVAVLDDAGLLFRRLPSSDVWPRFLVDRRSSPPEWLVLKASGPVAAGDLWYTIISGKTQGPSPAPVHEPSSTLARRTVAVLSVNDLRVEPVLVSKDLSWERAALDLARELTENPRLVGLRKLRFVVVSLGTDGAFLAEFPDALASEKQDTTQSDQPNGPPPGEKAPSETWDTKGPTFRLVFDPGKLEGDFNESVKGDLFGYQTCLAAAIATRLAAPRDPCAAPMKTVEDAARAGLAAMRRLLVEGHGPVSTAEPGFPFEAVARELVADEHEWHYGCVNVPADAPQDWTIVAGASGRSEPLYGLARRVALRGVSQLRHTPYLQFGDLVAIERSEIESLRTLKRLIANYEGDPKAKKPLSIAVFGPPGAGKSFGVRELAKAVFGADVPLLEFNLSQFETPAELHGLFHQVRDKALGGKTPVVFWDEFDSRDSMWLQHLLAPMQDGKFQEGQVTHPIGKCVFVFAGGTRSRFADFGVPEPGLDGDNARTWVANFKAKKGPDFKSRLAGQLDVSGPNRYGDQDLTFPVRRALLLRVQLGLKPGDRPVIDPGLLAAFLELKGTNGAPPYRYGARSLEKIAEQVKLGRRTDEFTRSDLPARGQLAMHVDADEFLQLVERDPRDVDFDELGRHIHEHYRALFGGRAYEDLDEAIKADNSAAARRIGEVLALAGMRLAPCVDGSWSPAAQARVSERIGDHIDVLAEGEHEGWMRARLSNGWRSGVPKSEALRQSHLLVPYEEFPAQARAEIKGRLNRDPVDEEVSAAVKTAFDKDREAVRNYVAIVARTGKYCIEMQT